MAGFRPSRERAPGAGVRNSVSLPCPLSERPKTDAAIYTVQKLFGTFLHKKVQEKENGTASCSQKFRGEQIFNSVQNDFVLDSSSVLRPPQNDRGERAPQNDGQGLEMMVGFCSALVEMAGFHSSREGALGAKNIPVRQSLCGDKIIYGRAIYIRGWSAIRRISETP